MKKNCCVILLILACVGILFPQGRSRAETLSIPAGTILIEAEAFYGDISLDRVVLPESITRIESKAFAYSTVRFIELPSQMGSIAPDAFQGCTSVIGYLPERRESFDEGE